MMCVLAASLLFAVAEGNRVTPVQVQAPEFPENAVKARMTGVAKVSVVVGPDGSVKAANAGGKPNPMLASVSEQAAREWRFEPDPGASDRTTVLTFEFDVKVDPPAKPECFVGPPRVTVILPDTVRILGWSRPPPPTVLYERH
jgi:TonB family protein